MTEDGSGRGDKEPRPGLFESISEALATFGVWLAGIAILTPVAGALGHIGYKLFRLGWDLIG